MRLLPSININEFYGKFLFYFKDQKSFSSGLLTSIFLLNEKVGKTDAVLVWSSISEKSAFQFNYIEIIYAIEGFKKLIFLTKSETTDLRWSVGLDWNADFSEMELQTKTASVLPIFSFNKKIEVNNPEENDF